MNVISVNFGRSMNEVHNTISFNFIIHVCFDLFDRSVGTDFVFCVMCTNGPEIPQVY